MEEKKLIELAKSGDKKALEVLLQNNYSILKGYLLKITLNEAIADDLTQDTIVKSILNIKKYEPKGKFSTWLITIGTNLYRDYLRKNKRLVYGDNIELIDNSNVEETVINKLEGQRLKKVLLQLPEDKRTVFILKHYYNYSYEEIAKIVDCPIGTVRSRLHYCIEKIRLQMKGMDCDE